MSDDSKPKDEGPLTQFPHQDATLLFESPIGEATEVGGPSALEFPDEVTTSPPLVEPTDGGTARTSLEAGTMVFAPSGSQASGTVRPGHVMLTPLAASRGETTRYTVTKLFAEGGLGKVWLASDKDLNREVVLKEIRPMQARDPQLLRRFIKEAQVTGQLEHPNIVPIYEMGKRLKDGRPFYTMRFVRGKTLRELIAEYQEHKQQARLDPLELPRLLSMFVSVCNAIAYAHFRGVIHRDLKPANVAVGEFGEVIVLDWGLAKVLDQPEEEAPRVAITPEGQTEDTLMGDVMGTPGYMAPEQAAGNTKLSDARTDIYGLGAILYAILIGKPPHHGERTHELLDNIMRGLVAQPRAIDPTVPAPLSAICVKAMQVRPEDRYVNVLELAREVERYLADEPVTAYTEPWWQRGRRWIRKHRTQCISTAAAAAVLIVGYGSWSWWDAHRVDRLRIEAREYTRLGQLALSQGALAEAKDKLSLALATVDNEPDLAEVHEDARQLLIKTQEQLRERDAREAAQHNLATFAGLRDKTLYHGTLFTGIDVAANIQAAKEAATRALGLFAVEESSPEWRLLDERHFTPRQREQIRTGSYELWLVLADAHAQPPAGKPADPRQAREALAMLASAQRLALVTQAFHLRKAQYLDQAEEPAAAAEERRRAAEIEPSMALDHFLVGDAFNKAGALKEAMRHFDQALGLEPDHFWSHYFLAVCHLKLQRPREAVAHLTAALTLEPDFGWTYLLRGYAYGHLDEFAVAEIDFRRAREKGVDEYGLRVNRGVVLIRQGKLDEAAQDLRLAIADRPDQYQAYVNLAVVHTRRGEFDESLKQLERAIRLAPAADTPYRARADVHWERGELTEALADLDRSVQNAVPLSAAAAADHLQRGRILHLLDRHEDALIAYDAAAEIDSQAAHLQYLRADALLALKRGDEALVALNGYLATKDTEPDAFRLRGIQRFGRGDPAGALADLTRSLESKPGRPTDPEPQRKAAISARTRRGWVYLTEATKLAFQDFDRAIELDPKNSDLYNGRGFAGVMLGNYRPAVDDAEKALQLGPLGSELDEKLALYHNAACIFAQAADRVVRDLSADDRQEQEGTYARRAVVLVEQAAQWLPEGRRGSWLKESLTDAAFDPIRHTEGFRRLSGDNLGK